jgi:hypothetical protein
MVDPPVPDALRVVLAGMSGLTVAVVRGCLAGQRDVEIVRELREADDLDDLHELHELHELDELDELAPGRWIDVVVTARAAAGVPDACRRLLFGPAAVPVIVIGSDGRLEIYQRRVVHDATPEDLSDAIRRAAARSVEPPPHG